MDGPLRIGVIGTGDAAKWHGAALQKTPGARLWSVCGTSLQKACDYAVAHKALARAPAYDKLGYFLSDPDLDAVIIATPDGLHAEQALAALRDGKHVLVEKPMALRVDDAIAMAALAKAKGLTLGVAYHHRWHAGHRELRRRIHEGALGDLRHMRLEWHMPPVEEELGGWRATDVRLARWWSMAALGSHLLDLAVWLAPPRDSKLAQVRGLFAGTRNWHIDETSEVSLRWYSSLTASISASVALPPSRIVEIHGAEASARCEWTLGARGGGRILVGRPDHFASAKAGQVVPGVEELAFPVVDPYAAEIADFAAAVREGRPCEVNGKTGVDRMLMLELVDASAKKYTTTYSIEWWEKVKNL